MKFFQNLYICDQFKFSQFFAILIQTYPMKAVKTKLWKGLRDLMNKNQSTLQVGLISNLADPMRVVRIIIRLLTLALRLILQTIFPKLFKNYNIRQYYTGIGQPAYFNSWSDFGIIHFLKSVAWVRDVSPRLKNDKDFDQVYDNYDYYSILKAYFPTNNSAVEAVNAAKGWENSYWNPKHTEQPDIQKRIQTYRKSDILFADLITNAQGIYKIKKVKKNDETYYKKAVLFFGKLLNTYRKEFGMDEGQDVINRLIEQQNLYYLDYKILRNLQKQKQTENLPQGVERRRKFKNVIKPTMDLQPFEAYIQIPFAIFAQMKGYIKAQEERKDFICLASVFNETFEKQEQPQEHQLFHCFSQDMRQRDKWEMAKIHIASTDANDFTFRIHLGWMHFGTSIYTTAFYNLAREKKQSWIIDQFLDAFSKGLLQIDFMGNLTLVDHQNSMLQKVYYMDRVTSAKLIIKENNNTNALEFNPDKLGEDSYQSDSIKMTKRYYQKLKGYIDYLFEKYKDQINGTPEQYGAYILQQLKAKVGKPSGPGQKPVPKVCEAMKDYDEAKKQILDALPSRIKTDQSFDTLKELMTNLAYIWTVIHAQTFCQISVAASFWLAPPLVSKPLSYFKNNRQILTQQQKREFLPPKQGIKDAMCLHKVISYREEKQSLMSRWNLLPTSAKSQKAWESMNFDSSFADYWNEIFLENYTINYRRNVQKGLFDLHWFMPHEIPMSLNI